MRLTQTQRRFDLVPESVTQVRQLPEELEDRLDPALIEDLRLVLSELVTNVIMHSGLGPEDWVEVRLEAFPEYVRGEVEDPSPGFEPPPVLSPTPDQNGGRGLFVVDRLASRWGVHETSSGTCVWFEMDCSVDDGPKLRSVSGAAT